ncbi:hypothetical protein [Salinibacterium sp. SWN1162]|uniref:hypothetical protein n=1 Tax=Salinibacterium sp. SWN1162 TaxID=2792053 RepID=UPI0018CDF85E|nr:hypothetical protein [Salinibacterium sp. SWN1162]MBH0008174.1 hypothetical protein [Salinibacterium sp. SWN1162]
MNPLSLADAEAEQCLEQAEQAEQADRLDRRNAIIVAILGFIGVVFSGALLILGQGSL